MKPRRRLIRPAFAFYVLAACGLALATAAAAPQAAKPAPPVKPAPAVKAAPATAAAPAAAPAALKSAAAGDIRPENIPPGYNFPTPRKVIDGWVATQATVKMRTHAWDVWAGMAAPSHATLHGQRLPIWETWFSENEVFVPAGTLRAGPRTEVARPFTKPRQFVHVLKAGGNAAAAAAASNEQVVAFNKFDPESIRFLMTKHATPKGSTTTYLYTQRADLQNLNKSWPAGIPVSSRAIVDFPDRGVDLKPVLWLIKQSGLTPFPLWQGTGSDATTNAKNPTPETWLNCVLIDPKGTGGLRPATPAEVKQAVANPTLACDAKKYLYAPLAMMYSFKMTAKEASDFNSAQQPSGPQAAAGDYAVLAAMHVTTKEIVNWTWQTFWWMGGKNPPKNFPGSNANMTANVKGPWRNYATCVAYSMVVPAKDPKGAPVVCFNPFLETSPGIPDGLNSNCMSCHGTARWPGNNNGGYPSTYLPNGYINFNDPTWFGNQTRTDFAWAIPGNAVGK
jgi:hypothetical protein